MALKIRAYDANGDALAYSASGLPWGLVINPGSGWITGTLRTAGLSMVTVTVSDRKGGTDTASFIWIRWWR